jgi:hypothetical protein
MTTSRRREERIAAFVRELAEEFDEIDDEQTEFGWLDAVETRAVEIGDAVTAELLKQTAAARVPEEESVCPNCGKQGRYRGQRERELIGRRGPVLITEPEYYCPGCRKSFFPEDRSAGG